MTIKPDTLEDIIFEVINNNLTFYCPYCERGVDQDEEMHVKIAQATKTWILDKFSKWVDNRIIDTKNYPGFWSSPTICSLPDVYRARIDTLNNARTNLENILEVE